MSELSDDERNLLRYQAEIGRIIHVPVRGAFYRHPLSRGYIKERTADTQGALVVVTAAGRKAQRAAGFIVLNIWAAEGSGALHSVSRNPTHDLLWRAPGWAKQTQA
jgi:hypothetical protein